MLALLGVACSALAALQTTGAHGSLRPVRVLRTTTGEEVGLTDQWRSDDRAVLVLMRSFG